MARCTGKAAEGSIYEAFARSRAKPSTMARHHTFNSENRWLRETV
jgi:hypothetical protein